MGVPSQPLPTIGQPNSTEDAKVRSALQELQTILTGGLVSANVANAGVDSSKLKPTFGLVTPLVSPASSPLLTSTDTSYGFATTVTPTVNSRIILFLSFQVLTNASATSTVTLNDSGGSVVTADANWGWNFPNAGTFTVATHWGATLTAGTTHTFDFVIRKGGGGTVNLMYGGSVAYHMFAT
jgi:hypothetical protein